MKVIVMVVFAACVALAAGAPSSADIQKLREQAAKNKACMSDCSKAAYKPICAGKPGDKPKSFASQCVLNNHNCEHNDAHKVISQGPCPGSGGIRLS